MKKLHFGEEYKLGEDLIYTPEHVIQLRQEYHKIFNVPATDQALIEFDKAVRADIREQIKKEKYDRYI